MPKLKLYIAGKVSPNSVFGTDDWRDGICQQLSQLSGVELSNLYSLEVKQGNAPESDPEFIFGRDCWLIQSADLVVVFLTDDISVGGSQEMLIAKYFHKPLLGIAPQEGKFRKAQVEIRGQTHADWVHPFVAVPCDWLVEDIQAAAEILHTFSPVPAKDLGIIDQSIQHYLRVKKRQN